MNLIQIGPHTINLDRVLSIHDLAVSGVSGASPTAPMRIRFGGHDHLDLYEGAETLRDWLSTRTEVVSPRAS